MLTFVIGLKLKSKFNTILTPVLQSLTEDVNRQTEREKQLQMRYAELQTELEDLQKNKVQEKSVENGDE